MTIEELETETIQNMLLAVQDLRRKYSGQQRITFTEYDCPLCEYSDEVTSPGYRCEFCPWYLFEGFGCVRGPREFLNVDVMYYETQTCQECLSRINRWEELIVEELATRRL